MLIIIVTFIVILKDIIFNYDRDKDCKYSYIYQSRCNKNLTINEKVVTNRRGFDLPYISPKWINKIIANRSDLILIYGDDLTNRNLNICIRVFQIIWKKECIMQNKSFQMKVLNLS